MTDTAFYADMDQLATELLTDFGSPATLRTIVVSKPNAEGKVQKTPTDWAGLGVRTNNQQVMQMFEKASSMAMVVKFAKEPAAETLIVHGNETWKIQEVKVVKPLGTSMIVAFVSCVKP